jgi:hypothetical protein
MTTSEMNPSAAQNGHTLHAAHNDALIKPTDTGIPNGKHPLKRTNDVSHFSNGVNGTSHTANELNDLSLITFNEAHAQENVPIAIVGMGLRLPEGIGIEEDL